MGPLSGKVCLVTGSNTGIGKETVRGLARQGASVVLAVRNLDKGGAALEELKRTCPRADLRLMQVDLGHLESVRAFGERARAELGRLDVLVNNAGVWTTSRSTTRDGFETTFGTNHLGTFALTRELLPLLERSAPSRVVVLSSKLHYFGRMHWEDPQFERSSFDGTRAYAQSKLANVLFTKALARRLVGKGVSANAVHPGVVATELVRDYPGFLVKLFQLFFLSPEQGARCSLHVASAPGLEEVSGSYFESSRAKLPLPLADDVQAQERLWRLSEELIEGTSSSRGLTSPAQGGPR